MKLWNPFKKTVGFLLIVSLVFAFSGCGPSEPGGNAPETGGGNNPPSGETYVLRMGNTATYPSQPNVFMREFKEAIESATDQITVELYEASTYGGPNEMIQGLQSGAFQSVCIPSGFYASVAPKSAILDLPFLFESPDECYTVLNGDTPTLDAYFESQGIIVAGWIYESNRDILSLEPITTFEDLRGKNLRTYSSNVSQEELQAYGANPIIMSTGDVPMALQQKTIDGIQCGNTLMEPGSYHELAHYLLVDAGTSVPIVCTFSKLFIDSLPQELQDLVLDTAFELITTSSYEYSKQYVEDCYTNMINDGTIVTECSEEMRSQMIEATRPVVENFLAEYPDMQAAYDEIQAGIEAYRSSH